MLCVKEFGFDARDILCVVFVYVCVCVCVCVRERERESAAEQVHA